MSSPKGNASFALEVLGSLALGAAAVYAFLNVAVGVPFVLGEALALVRVMRPMRYERTYEELANLWGLCHIALCALGVFGWYSVSRIALAVLGKERWSPPTMAGALAMAVLLLLYGLLPLGMLVCVFVGK